MWIGTMGIFLSLGLKQRMKKGWQRDRAFIRESRDWRNWPLRVDICRRESFTCCDTKKTIYCKAIAIVQSILSVYHINVPYSQWALWRHDNFVDFVIVLDWVCIRLLFKDLFEHLVGRFLNQLHDVHAQGVSVLLQKSWQNTALSDQRQFAF